MTAMNGNSIRISSPLITQMYYRYRKQADTSYKVSACSVFIARCIGLSYQFVENFYMSTDLMQPGVSYFMKYFS